MRYCLVLLLTIILLSGCFKAYVRDDGTKTSAIYSKDELAELEIWKTWENVRTGRSLPPNSEVLEMYGNGWMLIEFEGNTFLCKAGHYELVMTQIK